MRSREFPCFGPSGRRPIRSEEPDGATSQKSPGNPGERPVRKQVRFRTLGCYPLTGAIESRAGTLEDVIKEMMMTRTSERQGRVIDHDGAASMERKKQEGYF